MHIHIRILAILLFAQTFVACQQAPEKMLASEASIGLASITDSVQSSNKGRPSKASIVFKSADGGQTWQDVSTGLPAELNTEGVFTGGGEVFVGAMNGLYHSSAAEAPVWNQSISLRGRITSVFPGKTGLYACSYGYGLYQNISGTDIWKNLSENLGDRSVRTVLETPEGALLVGCDSGIFKSADGGQTWKRVNEGGLVLNLVASNGVLISGGLQGVLRSTDGGEHWSTALNENILAKKTSVIGGRFVTILGTKDPSVITPEGITSRLRVSNDGGKTWHRMEQALLPVQGMDAMDERLSQTKDIYDIVQAGDTLFCSFDTGIYRSSDQGKSWEPVLASNGKGGFYLAVSGKVIYAVQGPGGC